MDVIEGGILSILENGGILEFMVIGTESMGVLGKSYLTGLILEKA